MASLDNTLKIIDYKNLYIKNNVGLDAKELTPEDYKKFKKEKVLNFVVSVKVNNKKHRRELPPFYAVGKDVKTVISEADIAARQLIAELKQGKPFETIYPTFEELWNEHTELQIATRNMKTDYQKNNDYLFNKHLKPVVKNKKINEIETADLQGVINKMLKDGYAPSSADQIKKVFGVVFKNAIKKKYIESSPMEDVVIPKYDNIRDFTLSEEKSAKLYKAMMNYYSPKYRGIFMFLLEGRRKDEVLALTWDRVDLENNRYWFQYTQNKSQKNRTFVLPEHLKSLLETFEGPKIGYVFKNGNKTMANGGKKGGKIIDFRKRWVALLRSLDIDENIRVHDIRHWIGNTAVNNGATYEEVSYVLGQSSQTIAKRYAKIREKTADKTVRKVHDIMSGKKGMTET